MKTNSHRGVFHSIFHKNGYFVVVHVVLKKKYENCGHEMKMYNYSRIIDIHLI